MVSLSVSVSVSVSVRMRMRDESATSYQGMIIVHWAPTIRRAELQITRMRSMLATQLAEMDSFSRDF